MKRHGNLFHLIANQDALLTAYLRARQGKRNHRAAFEFARNLGAQVAALEAELRSGTYRPHPCNRFWVHDGRKPRLIEAPSFRDLVVQHALYAVVGPLFERRYIPTSFACRVGKGTHRAADWLQSAMRRALRRQIPGGAAAYDDQIKHGKPFLRTKSLYFASSSVKFSRFSFNVFKNFEAGVPSSAR